MQAWYERWAWAIPAIALCALTGCSTGDDIEITDDGTVITGDDESDDTTSTGAEADHLDAFRSQAGISTALIKEDYLDTSSIRHAGYQSIEGQLTHEETNTSNPFFWGFDVGVRVSQAATGTPNTFPSGINIVYEDVATAGGTEAVDLWWNSVYHRLPMMRHEVVAAGYGDRQLAASLGPAAGTPSTGPAYGTMNLQVSPPPHGHAFGPVTAPRVCSRALTRTSKVRTRWMAIRVRATPTWRLTSCNGCWYAHPCYLSDRCAF